MKYDTHHTQTFNATKNLGKQMFMCTTKEGTNIFYYGQLKK